MNACLGVEYFFTKKNVTRMVSMPKMAEKNLAPHSFIPNNLKPPNIK